MVRVSLGRLFVSRVEKLLEIIALELAHNRLRRAVNSAASSNLEANLTRVLAAKAHALGLAAPMMLTAKLEYRYHSTNGEDFVPSPEQALRIDAALWADSCFADKYARVSLLANAARVTVRTDPDGIYQGCAVELE